MPFKEKSLSIRSAEDSSVNYESHIITQHSYSDDSMEDTSNENEPNKSTDDNTKSPYDLTLKNMYTLLLGCLNQSEKIFSNENSTGPEKNAMCEDLVLIKNLLVYNSHLFNVHYESKQNNFLSKTLPNPTQQDIVADRITPKKGKIIPTKFNQSLDSILPTKMKISKLKQKQTNQKLHKRLKNLVIIQGKKAPRESNETRRSNRAREPITKKGRPSVLCHINDSDLVYTASALRAKLKGKKTKKLPKKKINLDVSKKEVTKEQSKEKRRTRQLYNEASWLSVACINPSENITVNPHSKSSFI